jgi:hypothetical protein
MIGQCKYTNNKNLKKKIDVIFCIYPPILLPYKLAKFLSFQVKKKKYSITKKKKKKKA